MKITHIQTIQTDQPITVTDCFVGDGYLQGESGSLPDVDIDYQSDRRHEVKAYIEQRYNTGSAQRVFSAGTFTTLKVKAVIKDVARTLRIPPAQVNYLTSMLDDACDYAGLFQLAYQNKRVAKFIADYPRLFEEIRTLMFQPRSSSVHASALIVTPDTLDGEDAECFDYTPIKKVDGLLVSEFDGYMLDELGMLKNDCLSTKELSKLQATIAICNREYDAGLSLESIASGTLDDRKVYEALSKGYTQNIFQFSSKGITKFLQQLRPTCIEDLIAANALYRPATLGNLDEYVNRKNGLVQPTYLWGTEEALRETFGVVVYQEQIVLMARNVGGFTLSEGVSLVKYISKKKTEKILAMKDKFMEGAARNGCPAGDAFAIWEQIEAAGAYCFNKSHAAAYAVTAYVGAYLKTNHPTAFYTVALQWADDDELVALMSEMEAFSQAKLVSPDINHSDEVFQTDYATHEIFWSLARVKHLGARAVQWIMEERNKNGKFTSIEQFIDRIFKYKLKHYEYWDDPDNPDEATRCPVNARSVLNLILSGCFDKVEGVRSVTDRYDILERAARRLGFEVKEADFPADSIGKHYFWSQRQVAVCGMGSVDYRRIYDNSELKRNSRQRGKYTTIGELLHPEREGTSATLCVTVLEVEEKRFVSKKSGQTEVFGKLLLQQNNEVCECVVWPEEYEKFRGDLQRAKGGIVVFSGIIRYSDYTSSNQIQFNSRTALEVI